MLIYKTTNTANGKIYVGYDTKNRPNYLGSGSKFHRALKKYGKENFRKAIIDSSDDFAELCLKEKFWIKFYNAKDPEIGYNLADGGFGNKGWIPSEEMKKKNCIAHRGKCHSEETKEKMRKAHKGKHHSSETIFKMSVIKQGENNPMSNKKSLERKNRLVQQI